MDPNISDAKINVNEDKRSTIIRVVHNRENPFVQLNKHALWDNTLSLKAVGLWARCMSRPNDWKFSIKELVDKCKEGRRAVDAAMQELIKANYVCRLEYSDRSEDGKFKNCGLEYVFFEFPATEEEKQEQLEIFKKTFRDCGFGNCRNGNSRNAHLLIKSLKKKDSTEKDLTPPIPPQKEEMPAKAGEIEKDESSKKKREKSDFSPKVRDLGNQIINALSRTKPDYLPPKNLSSLLTEVDFLMRIDKRDPQKAMDVLNWALADSFWADKMFKPNPAKYLREKFDQLEMKMTAKPPKNPNKIDRRYRDENGNTVDDWKDRMF